MTVGQIKSSTAPLFFKAGYKKQTGKYNEVTKCIKFLYRNLQASFIREYIKLYNAPKIFACLLCFKNVLIS